MSTTQDLKILVVEDNEVAIRNYRARFTGMGLTMPQFLTSFNDAQSVLRSAASFDLVILDLCIPEELGLPDAINNGFTLLQQCVKRDENPIPGLVIRTGKLAKVEQSLEREKLEKEFACGRLVLKSIGNIGDEIKPVIKQIHAFNRKETTGDKISPRERYLVRRLALKLEYQGFDLSLQFKEQYAHLQGSSFMEAGAKLFMGKPILESGMESPHRYYLAFIEGDGRRLDAAFEQAKQWAETCPHVSRPERFQSNRTELLCFQVAVPAQSPSNKLTIGVRRTRVCDLVFACLPKPDPASIAALIGDLAQYDAAYENLDEEFVRDVLEEKRTNSTTGWSKVAELTMRVGAFGETAGSEGDSDRRDQLANTFRQNHKNHQKTS